MKYFLLLVLTCLHITSAASAQNLEYFTALKGVNTARKIITSLGIADAKLIAINSHIDDDVINFQGIKNKLDSIGHALNWNYLFSYNADSRLKLISISKQNGNFTTGVRYDILTIDYNTIYEIENYTIDTIVEIPTGVVDSDTLVDSDNRFKDGTPIYYLFGWHKNISSPRYDLTFIWEKSIGYVNHEPYGVGGSHGTAWLEYSGVTGNMIGWYATTGIVETSTPSTLTLCPNPTTGSISIKGITTLPQLPVNVKIIDALGRIIHQENCAASTDGSFTLIWDGQSAGESLLTGAYSAVMTVGSVVKTMPFVVVR